MLPQLHLSDVKKAKRRRVTVAAGRDSDDAVGGGDRGNALNSLPQPCWQQRAALVAEARQQRSIVGGRDNDNEKTKATAAAMTVAVWRQRGGSKSVH